MDQSIVEALSGVDSSYTELRDLYTAALNQPDDYSLWEKAVKAAEQLEDGLNRNSSSGAIGSYRTIFDRFLVQFPLFFGWFTTYAKHEFAIGGTEAAEMVYERGVASIRNSADLWAEYCQFKTETCHDLDVIRELFERGAKAVGSDFHGHPFWDKYLEFEARNEAPEKIFAILKRVISIPMHQYNRYFERFRTMPDGQPLDSLAEPGTIAQIKSEVLASYAIDGRARSDRELERDVRLRVDSTFHQLNDLVRTKTHECWQFEQHIKRLYFFPDDLSDGEVENWHRYLDYEEGKGDQERIVFLYERCLVACAYYPEFWLRYVRYMYPIASEEDMRILYTRAVTLYIPIAKPELRHHFALFEEQAGRLDAARTIYEQTLVGLPGDLDTIVAWANFERRAAGIDAALQVFRDNILSNSSGASMPTKGALLGHMGRLAITFSADSKPPSDSQGANQVANGVGAPNLKSEEIRNTFQSNAAQFAGVREFWLEWLRFEADARFAEPAVSNTSAAPATTAAGTESGKVQTGDTAKDTAMSGQNDAAPTEPDAGSADSGLGQTAAEIRVRNVWRTIQQSSQLDLEAMREIFLVYKSFLLERGTGGLGAEARTVLVLDSLYFGPDSMRRNQGE